VLGSLVEPLFRHYRGFPCERLATKFGVRPGQRVFGPVEDMLMLLWCGLWETSAVRELIGCPVYRMMLTVERLEINTALQDFDRPIDSIARVIEERE